MDRVGHALRHLQQNPDKTAKQPRVALDDDAVALQLDILVAGAFLGDEGLKLDRLDRTKRRGGVKPAGKQDLVDQPVEFGDVRAKRRLQAGVGIALEEIDAEADARQRRPQLVRGVGEQHPVGTDQLVDAGGSAIEARGEASDLVPALDLDPGGKIAGAEGLDPCLQALEPPGEAAGHGIGRDADGERHDGEQKDQREQRVATKSLTRATSQRPSGSGTVHIGPQWP